MISARINNILAKLKKVKKHGSGWQASCPAHEDNNPSLSISIGVDGKILLHCHAGCSFDSIVQALGLYAKDLMPENGHSTNGSFMNIKEVYDYKDEQGKLVYQTVRLDPKSFRVRRPNGNGSYIWNLAEHIHRFPYRLPELLLANSQEVLIVEGEKDCDMAISKGFTATTNGLGAKSWRSEYGAP